VQTPFLIGTRIYLRPLERADAPLLAAFVNHPETRRTVLRPRPTSLAQEEAFLMQLGSSERDVLFGLALHEGGALVGVSGLHQIDPIGRKAQLGLLIGSPVHWGKGYGTDATRLMLEYAFGTLNLHKVGLQVFSNNPAGRRVYEKVGFTLEGTLREDYFVNGAYVDALCMGMLRSEWKRA
jgi:[ribosomal protein S5]-alanine N-acetyltransferase